jgi:prepilin-type N-terminal cleavage/methylation domain-containing protein
VRRNGFSLIEAVIVTALFALLVAIVLPAWKRYNLRQQFGVAESGIRYQLICQSANDSPRLVHDGSEPPIYRDGEWFQYRSGTDRFRYLQALGEICWVNEWPVASDRQK